MKNEIANVKEVGYVDQAMEVYSRYRTLQEAEEALAEKNEEYDKACAKKRRWQRITLVSLVLLLIILLYSCSSVMFLERSKGYNVVASAEMIQVDKSALQTMTSEQLLKESMGKDVVSNCLEWVYADGMQYIMRDGSTTYYSVDSLDSQIRGSLLDYEVSVEETKKPVDSHTAIVNKEFTWGFDDGSCQIAKRGTNELLFNGYSKALVEKYLVDNGVSNVYKAPVVLVLNKKVKVDDAFAEAMLNGVLVDNYMQSANTRENQFYGFESADGKIYYRNSSGDLIDVTATLKENIERYLGSSVKIDTKEPKLSFGGKTIIYLTSDNYIYDNFYFAEVQELY